MPNSWNTPNSQLIYLEIFREATGPLTTMRFRDILAQKYEGTKWKVPRMESIRRVFRLLKKRGLIRKVGTEPITVNNLNLTTSLYELVDDNELEWMNIWKR